MKILRNKVTKMISLEAIKKQFNYHLCYVIIIILKYKAEIIKNKEFIYFK